jgi:hypothetical protein
MLFSLFGTLERMYDKYLCLQLTIIGLCFITAFGSQVVQALSNDLPTERREFRKLLANNPNYFDDSDTSKWEPTMYEQLVCIGYNATMNLLEATIEIKRFNGFDGGLCTNGSTEYVRFYVDYGSGWVDVGIAKLNTHVI